MTKKIIKNNFIDLYKINFNKNIFYSLIIKKNVKNELLYSLFEYDIKDVEVSCDIDNLDLSLFNNIEHITNHGNIKKLILNKNNKNTIYLSGIIPNDIFHIKIEK